MQPRSILSRGRVDRFHSYEVHSKTSWPSTDLRMGIRDLAQISSLAVSYCAWTYICKGTFNQVTRLTEIPSWPQDSGVSVTPEYIVLCRPGSMSHLFWNILLSSYTINLFQVTCTLLV